jgi:hypothetical protein
MANAETGFLTQAHRLVIRTAYGGIILAPLSLGDFGLKFSSLSA